VDCRQQREDVRLNFKYAAGIHYFEKKRKYCKHQKLSNVGKAVICSMEAVNKIDLSYVPSEIRAALRQLLQEYSDLFSEAMTLVKLM
jgi:hypothetical protein